MPSIEQNTTRYFKNIKKNITDILISCQAQLKDLPELYSLDVDQNTEALLHLNQAIACLQKRTSKVEIPEFRIDITRSLSSSSYYLDKVAAGEYKLFSNCGKYEYKFQEDKPKVENIVTSTISQFNHTRSIIYERFMCYDAIQILKYGKVYGYLVKYEVT